MVKRVFEDPVNTFRTTVSVFKTSILLGNYHKTAVIKRESTVKPPTRTVGELIKRCLSISVWSQN